ncbi:ankyrin [Aspergillus affinis]|uniref:ankyrin n=1 Tax=Aspergillus affinis TaxID=1070780 RepID=UPI0022FDB910|nr:ankyrin [Aspergillus affinis]KAI9044106.1 ankyrin [Aspergillus affinis]
MLFAEHRKGTYRWFLQRNDFSAWKQRDSAVLFCSGIPGAGKTVLSSVVAHELDSECDARDAAVLMLYCKWDDPLSQSIDTLLGSLLKQATQKRDIILQEMAELYYKHSSAGTKPTREETFSMLTAELRRFSKTSIIVDGLDELREKTRVDLLELLTSIDATVNMMVTSRGLDNIVRHFQRKNLRPFCNECLVPCIQHHFNCLECLSSSSSSIDFNLCRSCFSTGKRCEYRGHVLCRKFCGSIIKITAVEEDLMTYVQWRVASSEFLRQCVELKEGLMKSIVDTVVKENDGIFLLAKFNMDTLTSKLRPAEVVKALKSLPKELDGTYRDAMLRVADLPTSHREVVMELLRWVVFAEQPLKAREIEHATAVTEGDRDIDRDNIIRANVLASKCAGLVVYDEFDRLRLVHFSAENFFNRNCDRRFPEGPTKLASTCLTYLLFETFQSDACSGSSESAEFDARIEKYPLLSYAAKFWGKHLVQAPHEGLYDRARELLDSPNHLAALTQILWYLDDEDSASWAGKQGSSALHLAAYI